MLILKLLKLLWGGWAVEHLQTVPIHLRLRECLALNKLTPNHRGTGVADSLRMTVEGARHMISQGPPAGWSPVAQGGKLFIIHTQWFSSLPYVT